MEITARTTYRGQVKKITNAVNDYLATSESKVSIENASKYDDIEEELNSFIQRLTSAHDNLGIANREIQEKNLLKMEEFEKVVEYEDLAVNALSRLKCRLEILRKRQIPAVVNTGNAILTKKEGSTRLERLKLKKFTGNHSEWLPFWQQFKVAVHENATLTGAEKFQYLQSVLTGNAEKTIVGFNASEECYDSAIALLQEEYGDTQRLIDNVFQQLMSLSPVTNETDVVSLRGLYNSIISYTRTLTALNVPPNSYSIMLKSIIIKALPNKLRAGYFRYHEYSESVENRRASMDAAPTDIKNDDYESVNGSSSSFSLDGDNQVKGLLKYLKREVESLERASPNKCIKHVSLNKAKSSLSTAAGLVTASNAMKCLFCVSNSHITRNCDAKLSIQQKKSILQRNGSCFRCTGKGHVSHKCRIAIICTNCSRRHATTMCDPGYSRTNETKRPTTNDNTVLNKESTNLYASATGGIGRNNILLQTARAFALSNDNKKLLIRLIIDGGSQRTYIRKAVVDQLKVPVVGMEKISLIAFGDDKISEFKLMQKVFITLKSQFNDTKVKISALVVPEICVDVLEEPRHTGNVLKRMLLADSNVNGGEQVDGLSILIGADFYWSVVTGLNKKLNEKLAAVETIFGWTLHGPAKATASVNMCTMCMYSSSTTDEKDCVNLWNLELLGIKSEAEEAANVTNVLQESCIMKVGRQYKAFLPWKTTGQALDSNREGALKRLQRLVHCLSRNPSELIQYHKAVKEFINAGFAEPVEVEDHGSNQFYLPQRPVYRPDKETTKIRVVFDASAHAPGMPSLNDQLHTGTNLLPDILKILVQFRVGSIGLVADIEKAFLQIILAERDRDSHRFFWFESKENSNEIDLEHIKVYRITRVTFGVTCSPFLLSATIRKHLNDERSKYPEIVKILENSFYMDDLIISVNSISSAQQIYKDSKKILANSGMKLRKWTTNARKLQDTFNEEITTNQQKVLGIIWHTSTDEISVCLKSANEFIKTSPLPTKRSVLQLLSRISDPFGILSPIIVRLKLIFQKSWSEKLDWDVNLTGTLLNEWVKCVNGISCLAEVSLPRCALRIANATNRQLHIFADASSKAFGAVAYIRSECNQHIDVQLMCAKGRLAPLKEIKTNSSESDNTNSTKELSVARLELTAALVASRLCTYIKRSVNVKFDETFLWTDSKITLYWIIGEGKKWQPFVANRLQEIRSLTNKTDWRHCAGRENPADLLTRGISAKQLLNSDDWFHGPNWLKRNFSEWPINQMDTPRNDCNIITLITLFTISAHPAQECEPKKPILNYEKFSSWNRILRITCYVIRFIKLKLKRVLSFSHQYPDAEELFEAERYWLSFIQFSYFSNEICLLQRGKPIDRASNLLTLSPFLDNEGLLRVGGRLQFADESPDAVHPIILPNSSYLTKLIVVDAHQRTFHRGLNIVLTKLRDRFWILKGRQLVKRIIHQCLLCRRMYSKRMDQPFAPLPRDRICLARPFEATGVDFAGPLYISNFTNRDDVRKVYIMIFTCAAMRAVHLESVLSLSTENCLLAIRRFVARRGSPRIIYSDNAKTFKRASLELSGLEEILKNEKFQAFFSLRRIKWQFIIERAPWWGGFWERLIRVVKDILKISIGRAKLNYEQLQTLLIETEDVVNSRPLTYISDDPLDMTPLTPNSFLKGYTSQVRSSNETSEITNATNEEIQGIWKSRLKSLSSLSKRWANEYLKVLRAHHHCKQIFPSFVNEGDVVLLCDPAVPRIHWRFARIESVYPGRDKRIRACLLRLADGSTIRRPIQMIYPLELQGKPRVEDVENIN